MRPGDPIESSISAIQTVLRKIHPSYEWVPPEYLKHVHGIGNTNIPTPRPPSSHASNSHGAPMSQTIPDNLSSGTGIPVLPNLQSNVLPGDIPMTNASVGSGDELLDLTQSDMGWDFDFSTMDLEEFFSVYPTAGPAF